MGVQLNMFTPECLHVENECLHRSGARNASGIPTGRNQLPGFLNTAVSSVLCNSFDSSCLFCLGFVFFLNRDGVGLPLESDRFSTDG